MRGRILFVLTFLFAAPSLAQEETPLVPSAEAPVAARSQMQREVQVPEAPFDLMERIGSGPSMTADRAAEMAASEAPELAAARAMSRASQAAVSRARAMMLPRLELTARYAHIDGFPDGSFSTGADPADLEAARTLAMSVTDPVARGLWLNTIDQQASAGSVSIAIPRDQIGFSARLTWPVSDLFFAMLPAMEAAESGARARELQERATEAQVRRSAREIFFQLARARGGLAVAQEAQRQAEALRVEVDAAVRAGFLTRTERLQADAGVASTEQAVASARAGVEIADAALRSLTGEGEGPPHGVGGSITEVLPAPEPVSAIVDRAVSQRPELEALRESLGAHRAAARASDASGYPHLMLYGGADLANPNRYMIPPQQEFQPSWEVGAMLTWAPNDALLAVHRGEELAAQAAAAEAQIERLERGVQLEVRRAHAELTAARERLRLAHASETAAQAAYDGRVAQLRAGHATTAEVYAAASQLHRARLSVLEAGVSQGAAEAALRYASGD